MFMSGVCVCVCTKAWERLCYWARMCVHVHNMCIWVYVCLCCMCSCLCVYPCSCFCVCILLYICVCMWLSVGLHLCVGGKYSLLRNISSKYTHLKPNDEAFVSTNLCWFKSKSLKLREGKSINWVAWLKAEPGWLRNLLKISLLIPVSSTEDFCFLVQCGGICSPPVLLRCVA